ncbi:MAG: site-specific integrase [Thermoplasmata archaeon]
MAQDAFASKALTTSKTSRSPSLPSVVEHDHRTSGGSFNRNGSWGLSEEPNVPAGLRWWNEWARTFAREKRGIGERWRRTIRQYLEAMPSAFRRAGRTPPESPMDVTMDDVQALKDAHFWANSTLHTSLVALREFLRWPENSLSQDAEIWLAPAGQATNRRWLAPVQLGALFTASRGRERVLVALQGFNGLRWIEVLRLHVRDLNLVLPNPTMRVLGKGRHGGKDRTIPIQPVAYAVLVESTLGQPPATAVFPHHERTADYDLRRTAARAGLLVPVSGHDLRRSFGRIAYQAGVSLVDLKYLYGHESVDMTTHYIGLDEESARRGLTAFGEAMRPHLQVDGMEAKP